MKKKIIDGSGKVLFDPADYNVLRITDDELQKTYIDKGISGTKYDAARQILGGDWRIPTKAEWNELVTNTNAVEVNGRWELTSKLNANKIIIEKDGYVVSDDMTVYNVNSRVAFGEARSSVVTAGLAHRNLNWRIIPVSMTQGVDLGLPSGVRWSDTLLNNGAKYQYGGLTPVTSSSWDNYMCTQDECRTSADPLMGYYEELEETDHYLNTRGLNIVRKQINDKIGEVEKGMPQPTPIADADETVRHVLGQEVQDNQVVVQPRSINELSDGSRVADLEEWQRSLGIFSIQRGTEEGSWIINVLDVE